MQDGEGGGRAVAIGTPTIELGSFLKLAGAAGTGGEAKRLVQSGAVRVNGATETRRGRKLAPGDLVVIERGGAFRVAP